MRPDFASGFIELHFGELELSWTELNEYIFAVIFTHHGRSRYCQLIDEAAIEVQGGEHLRLERKAGIVNCGADGHSAGIRVHCVADKDDFAFQASLAERSDLDFNLLV